MGDSLQSSRMPEIECVEAPVASMPATNDQQLYGNAYAAESLQSEIDIGAVDGLNFMSGPSASMAEPDWAAPIDGDNFMSDPSLLSGPAFQGPLEGEHFMSDPMTTARLDAQEAQQAAGEKQRYDQEQREQIAEQQIVDKRFENAERRGELINQGAFDPNWQTVCEASSDLEPHLAEEACLETDNHAFAVGLTEKRAALEEHFAFQPEFQEECEAQVEGTPMERTGVCLDLQTQHAERERLEDKYGPGMKNGLYRNRHQGPRMGAAIEGGQRMTRDELDKDPSEQILRDLSLLKDNPGAGVGTIISGMTNGTEDIEAMRRNMERGAWVWDVASFSAAMARPLGLSRVPRAFTSGPSAQTPDAVIEGIQQTTATLPVHPPWPGRDR